MPGEREAPQFSSVDEIVGKVTEALADFGGCLRCESCGQRRPLGNVGSHITSGWPTCCGYTMRWWTAHQVAAGEDQR